MGNHEWFTVDGNTGYYCLDMYNDDQIGNNKNHYYYVDNKQTKIRYIMLNAYTNTGTEGDHVAPAYTTDQINWLTNTALDIPSGWGVIVFTHWAYDTGSNNMRNALDTAKANGKDIIAVFTGHSHWDSVNSTTGGIPIIITTSDKNLPYISGGVNTEPYLNRDRPSGTIYEQAFDVVIVDRKEREIHAVRIGGLAMDNHDQTSYGGTGFDDEGTLEERTITY
jgi:hypothetical protein